jgi:hypothetical protein
MMAALHTIIRYMLHAAKFEKDVIRILGDDTVIFGMLAVWVWNVQFNCWVQMERSHGIVVDINMFCTVLDPKCL